MSEVHAPLADQALENLVNQFARPLDLLRELVQNAIDAGTPRIEVRVVWVAPRREGEPGVVELSVDDFGEGMDEAIIDGQLTRLFASSKEDDLTKIGKFGIGFTSIFAIKPDAVLLRTGKRGQSWELLFHADRSYDKARVEAPVHGTKITLYKRMEADRVEPFVAECREVLWHWCEHSDVPITFHDLRGAGARDGAEAGVEPDDPFAAFAQVSAEEGEVVATPLSLDAELSVRHTLDGLDLLIGVAESPRYGFYNGGLTLLQTADPSALGAFADRLGHLSFKLKCDRLEHTLTRDNVLQDEAWNVAMRAVVDAAEHLTAALLDRTEAAAAAGEPLSRWHVHLTRDLAAGVARGARPLRPEWRFADRRLFRDVDGSVRSLDDVTARARKAGILVARERSALTDAVSATGLPVLEDSPGTRALLALTEKKPALSFLAGPGLRSVEDVFLLPRLVDEATLPEAERVLLGRVRELLARALVVSVHLPGLGKVAELGGTPDSRLNRVDLLLGDFAAMHVDSAVLALNGPGDGKVFEKPAPPWLRLPPLFRYRSLLVHRRHPVYQAYVVASAEDPVFAAAGLASALLATEEVEGDAVFRRLAEAARVDR